MVTTVARRLTGNLPAEVTSFVGRKHELAHTKQMLQAARLVTLTGPGGVGKTRLTRRVADAVHRAFPDGVWMVALADLEDGALVAQAFADALGLHDESTEPLARLTEYVSNKRLLLVADNCEHLLDPCARLVATLLSAAPGIRVLATSRQVLGVEGEQVLPVPPLTVPDPDGAPYDGEAHAADAMTLLAERATAANPNFRVTDENRKTLAAICQRLEGIPLALELAALRFRIFTPEQVLDRLDDALHLLTAGPRTSPQRQQTLDAAIRWSYDLCSEKEQRLWQQLSIFSGGFDVDAVDAVCAEEQTPPAAMVDVLAGLVDKSILSVDPDPQAARARYRMLAPLRQFGLARLSSTGGEIRVRQRHRDHYQRLAERGATAYHGPDDVAWFHQTRQELANLRAALQFSLSEPGHSHHALEIATGLRPFWEHYGFLLEGYRWLQRALARDTAPTALRARALSACSFLALLLSEKESAAQTMAECATLAKALDAADVLAETTLHSALLAFVHADVSRAHHLAELAVRRCHAASNPGVAAESLAFGFICAFVLQLPRAGQIARSFLDLTDSQGSHLLKGLALWSVGLDHWRLGDQDTATAYLRQAIELFTLFERSVLIASGLDALAWSAAARDDHERAARLMGAASTVRQRSTMRLAHTMTSMVGDDMQHQVRAALGNQAFAAAFTRGAALTLNEAVDYALGRKPTAGGVRGREREGAILTRRERDVARLVAAGLSNQRIADELVISVRTAETHVEHILTKLGFRSRTQIATWLREQEQ